MAAIEKWHFILVHGSFHGAWCWYKIVDLLQKSGHLVTTVDLASAGIHPVDAKTITSFEQYNQPLVDLLHSLPDSEKVVLVGHSMAGISLTAAAELFPNKIFVTIYVVALMLRFGSHDQEGIDLVLGSFIRQHRDKCIFEHPHGPNEPPSTLLPLKEVQESCFYQHSPSEDKVLAATLLRPFPLRIFNNGEKKTTEEETPEEGSGSGVPRVYIRTERDETMHLWKQDKMIKDFPPDAVYSMDSDHSPFFSDPHRLHELLLKIAAEYSLSDMSYGSSRKPPLTSNC